MKMVRDMRNVRPHNYLEKPLTSNIAMLKPLATGFPELNHVLTQSLDILPEEKPEDKADILEWIKVQHLESRGYGLPAVDFRILPVLWQKQSHNWNVITLSFMNDIILYVHDFICRLLTIVCPDTKVRNALLSVFMDDLVAKYSAAIKHVEYILKVEHRGTLITKSASYSMVLNKMQYARLVNATKSSVFTTKMKGEDCIPVEAIELSAAALAMSNSNLDKVVKDYHDVLYAYYEVAMRRFVDTVITQGMDDHLITGENSPIKVIKLSFTSKMTDDQINDIAGEDEFTKGEREALKKKIKALEDGRAELWP